MQAAALLLSNNAQVVAEARLQEPHPQFILMSSLWAKMACLQEHSNQPQGVLERSNTNTAVNSHKTDSTGHNQFEIGSVDQC